MSKWVLLLAFPLVLDLVLGSTTSKFNVLLLVADDLRPFGAETITPNLDKLATESLTLTNHYVNQAVCGPTRASFLTGRRPDTLRTVTHTAPTYWRERAGDFWTLPQMLKENGWHTVRLGYFAKSVAHSSPRSAQCGTQHAPTFILLTEHISFCAGFFWQSV